MSLGKDQDTTDTTDPRIGEMRVQIDELQQEVQQLRLALRLLQGWSNGSQRHTLVTPEALRV